MARAHGKASTYSRGCRCRPCTDAATAYKRRLRVDAAGRMASDPTVAEHGSYSTYRNWSCRCQPCKDAHTREMAVLRAARTARLAADPCLAPHGRASTYQNWGCRCESCSGAHAAKKREARRG